ncbi:MAG TPA: hypothetical protein VLI67_03245 [Vicinamibacteria bacterium]|nr:hypothetical protein [Vicinamibacteria bacterium]
MAASYPRAGPGGDRRDAVRFRGEVGADIGRKASKLAARAFHPAGDGDEDDADEDDGWD